MRANRLVAIGCAIVAMLGALSSEARYLQVKDYLSWEWVSNPQVSPNGKTIVYTRTHVNKQTDRFENELWVMDADGKRNRRLLEQSVSSVVWSPDSSHIAYVAETKNGNEIFVRRMDAQGGIIQLTHDAESPSKLSWSPDGKWIAYRARVLSASKSGWNIKLPDKPAEANWAPDAAAVNQLHWRKDGVGIKPEGHHHIFVVPSDGGVPRQVTTGAWQVGEYFYGDIYVGSKLEWSPDGDSIVFSANMEENAELMVARSYLYAVDVSSGDLRRITQSPEFAMMPIISPDGKSIVYIGMDNTTESNFPTPQLRVVNVNGTNNRVLIKDIHDIWFTSTYWSPDSRGLYYVYGMEGAHNLHYVSLDGESKPITSGAQSFSIASISDNGVAAGTRTTAEAPGDIVRFDLATGHNLQRLTAVNDDVLEEIELGQVEEIWYDSTESTRVQGWIVYPPNFDPNKKYPLILDIHGGPESMYTSGWMFSIQFMFQEWASQGYVVLYTNPRGSSGYGSDFARAIYNAYPGERDYQDLMHGVDAVIARGFIDEERMYVQGCSGGGTLTAWVVTQTDRFAAAGVMCPIINMISFAGSTDIPIWAYNRFKQPFWDDPTAWLEHSAIMHVNKVKTPSLLMVGENDLRTTVDQPVEFYTALKLLRVPTKLIFLKEEAHATWLLQRGRPSNVLRSQLYLRKWYGEWRRVKGEDGPIWQSKTDGQHTGRQ